MHIKTCAVCLGVWFNTHPSNIKCPTTTIRTPEEELQLDPLGAKIVKSKRFFAWRFQRYTVSMIRELSMKQPLTTPSILLNFGTPSIHPRSYPMGPQLSISLSQLLRTSHCSLLPDEVPGLSEMPTMTWIHSGKTNGWVQLQITQLKMIK